MSYRLRCLVRVVPVDPSEGNIPKAEGRLEGISIWEPPVAQRW